MVKSQKKAMKCLMHSCQWSSSIVLANHNLRFTKRRQKKKAFFLSVITERRQRALTSIALMRIKELLSHHGSAGFCYCLHFVLFCQKLKIMSKVFVCFHTSNNQTKISKDLQMIALLLGY